MLRFAITIEPSPIIIMVKWLRVDLNRNIHITLMTQNDETFEWISGVTIGVVCVCVEVVMVEVKR